MNNYYYLDLTDQLTRQWYLANIDPNYQDGTFPMPILIKDEKKIIVGGHYIEQKRFIFPSLNTPVSLKFTYESTSQLLE